MPYICLSEEAYAKLAEYTNVYGTSNERTAEKAVAHWWEEIGKWSVHDARQKGIDKKPRRTRKTVVSIRRPSLVRPRQPAVIRAVNQ